MADAILSDASASGIYQIRNLRNGKRYIGSAVNISARWRQHQCELRNGRHNPHLQNAWRKYGQECFVFEIIELVAEATRLIDREQHYIDQLAPEYNVATIAGSNLGIRWSDAVRARMAVANKAVWERPGHREKMSEAHIGYKASEEHRLNLSKARKGKKLSPDHVAKIADRLRNTNASPEHRAKMSAYWKGRKKSPEQIAKMAESKRGKPAHNRGKPMSEEQKAKQSAAMKERYRIDPEFALRISEATKAAMRRPEVMEKTRAASASRVGKPQDEKTIAKRADGLRAAWARSKAQGIPFRSKIRA